MKGIPDFIRHHQKFAITSHARPDGDAIGSEVALALALRQIGKDVHVVNADRHPSVYDFLPGIDLIEIGGRFTGEYDALIILECSDVTRTGVPDLERHFIINIDHHQNTQAYGDLNWVDDKAAAVAEMVFLILKEIGVEITPDIATNLYVAIMTDTGSFQFSNTSARTFEIARELVGSGADPSGIAQAVYMSHSHSKLLLLSKILDTLEIHPSGKIAWVALTQQMLRETGASVAETEGVVNYPLSINGIVMVAFFKEEGKNKYRVSLRSKDHYNVSRAAEEFGGGGHINAAGLWAEGSYEEVKKQVIHRVERLLTETPPDFL